MKNYHVDFYIDRLVKEWLAHEKIIVGCDVDDTLIPYNGDITKFSCERTLRVLKDCEKEGIILVINTAREKARHAETKTEIEALGLKVASVNRTPANLGIPYGKDGKIYANIFLDDRAGLEQAIFQLENACQIVKHERQQQKLKL